MLYEIQTVEIYYYHYVKFIILFAISGKYLIWSDLCIFPKFNGKLAPSFVQNYKYFQQIEFVDYENSLNIYILFPNNFLHYTFKFIKWFLSFCASKNTYNMQCYDRKVSLFYLYIRHKSKTSNLLLLRTK